MTPLLTIRSTAARVGAWAWTAFAALNLLDIALRGRDMASAVMAAVLLLGCGIAYVMGLRPAVVADDGGLTVRNPLRDARVPWTALRGVEGTHALVFTFADPESPRGERAVKAWVHQTSPRAQARAEARAARQNRGVPAAKLKGRTPTAYAAQQLSEIADRHRPKAGGGKDDRKGGTATKEAVTGALAWSRPAVAALAVPGALVAATGILALVI
ncbi:PH domain-containing protein [Spirillospora sp. CA-255316]